MRHHLDGQPGGGVGGETARLRDLRSLGILENPRVGGSHNDPYAKQVGYQYGASGSTPIENPISGRGLLMARRNWTREEDLAVFVVVQGFCQFKWKANMSV